MPPQPFQGVNISIIQAYDESRGISPVISVLFMILIRGAAALCATSLSNMPFTLSTAIGFLPFEC